jgi:glycosyltransferase involved in cell wall biosynthesis
MIKNTLSIIIPTYRYTKYLDKAISSCLNLKFVEAKIFVNINSVSKDFEKSPYWNNKKIQWRYIKKPTSIMVESINDAIDNSYGEWIFILSDDDIVHNNFLKGINLNNFNSKTIFMTRINIINENDNIIRVNNEYNKNHYTRVEAMKMFFDNKFHNHLSLIVFSRELYQKVGKFCFSGYPNGYYNDTIFHGKIIANSDQLFTSKEVMFSRRESSFQGSSLYYFGKEVNTYFKVIMDAFFNDKNFKKEALNRYGSKDAAFRAELQNRFDIDFYKFFYPIYNTGVKEKINFLYSFLIFWNTGIIFKIKCLTYRIPLLYFKVKIKKLIK